MCDRVHNKIVISIVAILVIFSAGYFLFINYNSTKVVIPKNYTNNTTTTYNISYDPTSTYNVTTSIQIKSNGVPPNKLIEIALQEYRAPYCQGISQAPVGQSGLPCAAEVGSTYYTFNSTSGAFDCAGFVQYVYSQIGIKIPRTSQAQFGNFYPGDAKIVPVPSGQANTVPGDLVYFSIPGDHDPEPAHVAMCFVAGCNTIIQDGGPPPGWPGTIAPLNAALCTDPNANPKKCVMGFMQVTGSPIFISNQSKT